MCLTRSSFKTTVVEGSPTVKVTASETDTAAATTLPSSSAASLC